LGSLGEKLSWSASRFAWPKCLRNIAGSFGQAAKYRVVHVRTLFSLDFPELASFAEVGFVCGNIIVRWVRLADA
jgi:hypothetical protein